MGYHIWTLKSWQKRINTAENRHKSGLRLHFESGVNGEVKSACKDFAAFLREKYFFPLRINVYIKSSRRITAADGEKVVGTFFSYFDIAKPPYIRVAAGDYIELCKEYNKKEAIIKILQTLAHELTHYFQYINDIKLTKIGEERQATNYSFYIIEEYIEYRKKKYSENFDSLFSCLKDGSECSSCTHNSYCSHYKIRQ